MADLTGTGTYTKKGEFSYEVNCGITAYNEHYDISNNGYNGVVIFVKRNTEEELQEGGNKRHDFDIIKKPLKKFKEGKFRFDISNTLVVLIEAKPNESLVDDYYTNIKTHFENAPHSVQGGRPISTGTGIARGPLGVH